MRKLIALALFLALVGLVTAPVQAAVVYQTILTPGQEVPVPTIPAGLTPTGFGTVILNDAETMIDVSLTWSGLSGPATNSHIHGPALPGVATGVIFGLGPVLPITNVMFAVTPAQATAFKAGLWYFNVHTQLNPAGEIRGQLTPEPGTWALLISGLAGLAFFRRRRIS